MLVIDANAAIEVARGTVRGDGLSGFLAASEKVIAPSLFVSEAANSTWKYAVHGNPKMENWSEFYKVVVNEVDEFVPDSELVVEALKQAVEHNHSVYDMLYFVLAKRTASPLLTCDKRLAKLCEENNVDCITVSEI